MNHTKTNSKSLHITLWILQALLGAAFIFFGGMKTFTSFPPGMNVALAKFIGISELAGGIGLILPSLLRIQPKLTAWAATGILVIMILAAGYHIYLKEYSGLALITLFAASSALIAWGRFTKVPILAKN